MSFQRVLQENFNGAAGLAYNVDTNGNTETIKILSKYANTDVDNPAVQNFDNLNTGLTPIYAPRNSAGDSYMISYDSTGNPLNRAPRDRYYWSGEIVTDTSTYDAKFKWSTISDGTSSYDTDGFLLVPEPFVNHDLRTANQLNRTAPQQTSFRVNLQFNDLQPFTWVPLMGVTNNHISSPQANITQVGNVYTSNLQNWNYTYPPGISTNTSTIYGDYTDMWSVGRNMMTWFIYCHDGNGKGMVATCAGEIPSVNSTDVPHYPTNEYHGDASKNGYLKWKAPQTLVDLIDDLVADPTVNNNDVLQTAWETYGGNGASRADGKTGYEAEIRQWYKYWRDDANVAFNRAGIAAINYGMSSSTAPEYSKSAGRYVNRNQGDAQIISGRPATYSAAEPVRTFNAQQRCASAEYLSSGNAGNRYDRKSYPAVGAWNWNHGIILGYGATTNADLSSPQELYLNATIITDSSVRRINNYGINSTQTNAFYGGNSANPCQLFYAGRLMDFTFSSIPGQLWYDQMQFTAYTGYKSGFRYSIPSGSAGASRYFGRGPKCLALRPTIEGDGQINSFAIGSYAQSTGKTNWTNNATLSAYFKPDTATIYNFPTIGYSYDPTDTAGAGNAATFQDAAGNPITSNPDPSWRNPQNLFDNDPSTRAEILKEGEANALYVQLNGFLGGNPPADSLELSGFTTNIRGVTQSAIYEHKLRFQITKSDRTTVLFETADDTPEAANIQVPNDSSGIYPTQNGVFNFYFKSTTQNTVTYGDIKDGYIKIWAQELPKSYTLNVTAPDSSAYYIVGTDRTGPIDNTNPPLELRAYDTVEFVVNAPNHPFYIKTAATTGSGDQVVGVVNNGTDAGTVTHSFSAAGTYYYQCSAHGVMGNTITVTA